MGSFARQSDWVVCWTGPVGQKRVVLEREAVRSAKPVGQCQVQAAGIPHPQQEQTPANPPPLRMASEDVCHRKIWQKMAVALYRHESSTIFLLDARTKQVLRRLVGGCLDIHQPEHAVEQVVMCEWGVRLALQAPGLDAGAALHVG